MNEWFNHGGRCDGLRWKLWWWWWSCSVLSGKGFKWEVVEVDRGVWEERKGIDDVIPPLEVSCDKASQNAL